MKRAGQREWLSRSPDETLELAAKLAENLEPGDVLALFGELGAGKTTFVQGLAQGLEVSAPVTSPSFALIQEYAGRLPLYHVDLYRLRNVAEALELNLDEYFEGRGVTVIEWAERLGGALPKRAVRIRLEPGSQPNERKIVLTTEDA